MAHIHPLRTLLLLLSPLLLTHAVPRCDENCAKCHLQDWNLEWVCYECQPGYKLWVDKCVAPCGKGWYQFGNTPGSSCRQCTKFCDECVGTDIQQCTKCTDGWHLDKRGICVKNCASNEYSLADGGGCDNCDASCKTCVTGFLTGCTSCHGKFGLNVVEPLTGSGICVEFCPPDPVTGRGMYRETPNYGFCKYCAPACKKCLGQKKCLECFDTHGLSNGICYASAANAEDKRFASFIGPDLYNLLFNETVQAQAELSGIVVPKFDPSSYDEPQQGTPGWALQSYLQAYNDLYGEEE